MFPDFTFHNHGSLWLCLPNTDAARAHLLAHVGHETQQWAGGIAVEPRYVEDLVAALRARGYTVGG